MLLTLLLILTFSQSSSGHMPVVERGRVGSVAIGDDANDVYAEFRGRAQLVDLALDGHLSRALALKLFGSQVLTR